MNIIIIGGGKTAYFLAKNLLEKHHRLALIINNPDEGHEISRRLDAGVFDGEGTDIATLEKAGGRSADILLSLTPFDHKNLIACQIAKEEFDIPKIIALVNDPENEKIFIKLGVPMIFSSTRVIAELLEEQTELTVIRNLMALAKGNVNVSEIILPETSPALEKSLQELSPPQGFLVAAAIREGVVFIPKGSFVLKANDHLIVISQTDVFGKAMKMLTGE